MVGMRKMSKNEETNSQLWFTYFKSSTFNNNKVSSQSKRVQLICLKKLWIFSNLFNSHFYVLGTCVCDDGYGGGDCGIDMSIPPIINGVVDSGLCDLDLINCTSAVIEGDGFTNEGNPTCRIKTITVLWLLVILVYSSLPEQRVWPLFVWRLSVCVAVCF